MKKFQAEGNQKRYYLDTLQYNYFFAAHKIAAIAVVYLFMSAAVISSVRTIASGNCALLMNYRWYLHLALDILQAMYVVFSILSGMYIMRKPILKLGRFLVKTKILILYIPVSMMPFLLVSLFLGAIIWIPHTVYMWRSYKKALERSMEIY